MRGLDVGRQHFLAILSILLVRDPDNESNIPNQNEVKFLRCLSLLIHGFVLEINFLVKMWQNLLHKRPVFALQEADVLDGVLVNKIQQTRPVQSRQLFDQALDIYG